MAACFAASDLLLADLAPRAVNKAAVVVDVGVLMTLPR